jgi:hypothetical protein
MAWAVCCFGKKVRATAPITTPAARSITPDRASLQLDRRYKADDDDSTEFLRRRTRDVGGMGTPLHIEYARRRFSSGRDDALPTVGGLGREADDE